MPLRDRGTARTMGAGDDMQVARYVLSYNHFMVMNCHNTEVKPP